jgi:hypothetical protein
MNTATLPPFFNSLATASQCFILSATAHCSDNHPGFPVATTASQKLMPNHDEYQVPTSILVSRFLPRLLWLGQQ